MNYLFLLVAVATAAVILRAQIADADGVRFAQELAKHDYAKYVSRLPFPMPQLN